MPEDKFERWVREAVDSLPSNLRIKLQNIQITVQDYPPSWWGRTSSLFLGIYQGVPLIKRSVYFSNIFPDRITIFRRPIQRVCSSEEEMRHMVIKTVLHEIGHYFGLKESELRRLSLH